MSYPNGSQRSSRASPRRASLPGADSLGYISLEQLIEATTVPEQDLCRACFDGVYPVKLPEPEFLGKHLLEIAPLLDADGLTASLAGGGAPDALGRP